MPSLSRTSITRSQSLGNIAESPGARALPSERRGSHGHLEGQQRPQFTLNFASRDRKAAAASDNRTFSFSTSPGRIPSLYAAALRAVAHMDPETIAAAIRWAPPSEGSESPEYRAHMIDTLLERTDPKAGAALLAALKQFGSDPRELAYVLTRQAEGERMQRLIDVLPPHTMQPILHDIWHNAQAEASVMIQAAPGLVTNFPADALESALLHPTLKRCAGLRLDQGVSQVKAMMDAVPSRALMMAVKAGSMQGWLAYFSMSSGPRSLTEWKIALDRAPGRAVRDGLRANPGIIDLNGLHAMAASREQGNLRMACTLAPDNVLDQRDAQGLRFADHLKRRAVASLEVIGATRPDDLSMDTLDAEIDRDMALFILKDRGFGPVATR